MIKRDSTKITLPYGTDDAVVPAQNFRDVQKLCAAMTDVMQKRPNTGEFLSGFWKEDRLIPSVTVMLYFSSDVWDGPLSLFDMMEVKNSRIFSFLDNYHVCLIAPAQMTDEEIMKFQSSLPKDRKN